MPMSITTQEALLRVVNFASGTDRTEDIQLTAAISKVWDLMDEVYGEAFTQTA